MSGGMPCPRLRSLHVTAQEHVPATASAPPSDETDLPPAYAVCVSDAHTSADANPAPAPSDDDDEPLTLQAVVLGKDRLAPSQAQRNLCVSQPSRSPLSSRYDTRHPRAVSDALVQLFSVAWYTTPMFQGFYEPEFAAARERAFTSLPMFDGEQLSTAMIEPFTALVDLARHGSRVRLARDAISLLTSLVILGGAVEEIHSAPSTDTLGPIGMSDHANEIYGVEAVSTLMTAVESIKAPLTLCLSYPTLILHHLCDEYLSRVETTLSLLLDTIKDIDANA
jgi:hypothetical protein